MGRAAEQKRYQQKRAEPVLAGWKDTTKTEDKRCEHQVIHVMEEALRPLRREDFRKAAHSGLDKMCFILEVHWVRRMRCVVEIDQCGQCPTQTSTWLYFTLLKQKYVGCCIRSCWRG